MAVALAQRRTDAANVEFRKGYLEEVPVEDRSVVIDFRVDPREGVFPMVAAGTSNDDIILGPEFAPHEIPGEAPISTRAMAAAASIHLQARCRGFRLVAVNSVSLLKNRPALPSTPSKNRFF